MGDNMQLDAASRTTSLKGWIGLGVLAVAAVVVYFTGAWRYLTLESLYDNRIWLKDFISANLALALLIYAAVYVASVALSLPGGLLLTVAGGFLFGWVTGGATAVVAATVGATLVFLIARSSLGAALSATAGPWLAALRDGFRDNALSYLLFLRLVPAFPFVVVNLAPALLGVPLGTYVLGTFIGIIPGTLAFAYAGTSLDSVFVAQGAAYDACMRATPAGPCSLDFSIKSLVTTELLIAFVVLALISLLPILVKRWRGRAAAG
jgi:uncharacterized membrane protein YdjX (TVP38/TMEM64 family)